MSLKNGCNNLYFHPYSFNKTQKSFSYLTSLSRGDLLNQSTPTFRNINLTETITNLSISWEFN